MSPATPGMSPTRGGGDEAVWQMAGPRVGLLRAHYLRQSFPRHTHDCFVVCVNERGAHGSWYAGSTRVIPPRAVCVVPPGEVHTGYPVPGTPWHYRAMYPDPDLIATLMVELGMPAGAMPTFAALHVNDAALAEAFLDTHRQCEAGLESLEIEARIAEILMAVLRRHATGARRTAVRGNPRLAVRRAMDYIRACHARHLTLEDIAAAAGISRYALLRAFRRDVGIAPYEFATQVRIERAKHLLRTGVAISVVAQSVGFTDQSHLTRRFRRLVGVTPGVFARATDTARRSAGSSRPPRGARASAR